jgi:SAM-dependent methyltransferase
MTNDNTIRFSNRVADYVKYRPGYPQELLAYLQEHYGLSTEEVLADIGSGTGISSAYFLEAGYTVTGIEPNKEMREKSAELLEAYLAFKAIDGTAEDTTLAEGSVDVIISGQAFHWFDVEKARVEFKRILKEEKMVVLFWNERRIDSAFEKAYEKLILKHARDYVKVDHRAIDLKSIQKFFYPGTCELKEFPNFQAFDFDGLKGRLLSSSYMPQRDEKGYEEMLTDLEQLYYLYEEADRIRINYTTKVYVGILG